MGKKTLLVQFDDGNRKEMSSSSLHFLFSKGEVEIYYPKSKLPKKEKGEYFIIDGGTEVQEASMFERGIGVIKEISGLE